MSLIVLPPYSFVIVSEGNGSLNIFDAASLAIGSSLSNNNLTITTPDADNTGGRSVNGKSSGKWYFEASFDLGSSAAIGVGTATSHTGALFGNHALYYTNGGVIAKGGWGSFTGSTYGNGTIVGVALDADLNKVSFYKNGVFQGTQDLAAYIGPDELIYAVVRDGGGGSVVVTANFGATPFAYPVPAGFTPGF